MLLMLLLMVMLLLLMLLLAVLLVLAQVLLVQAIVKQPRYSRSDRPRRRLATATAPLPCLSAGPSPPRRRLGHGLRGRDHSRAVAV